MISIVFPVYNEKNNLSPFLSKLHQALKETKEVFELIGVDDGSTDGSFEELRLLASTHPFLKIVRLSRNFGQTAALAAGIAVSSGGVVITIDSDLENDPADIPKMLGRLAEGCDVVSGWRQDRWKGQPLSRRLPSQVANWLISKIGGLRLHDYGCTLKVYRRELLAAIPLYGEMHRFIPAYLHWNGARVAEVPVRYQPRKHGKSNYGMSRMYRVVLDLLLIKFLTRYMNRPIHFFGGIGLLAVFCGIFAGGFAVFLKLFVGLSFVRTPLPILAVFFIIIGVQLIVMGVLAELIMRTYYESQHKTPYQIKEKINFQ